MAGGIRLRPARKNDLDALEHLEITVFPGDRLSRRSLRRYINAATTTMIVAEAPPGTFAGYALVAFRAGSRLARLYSIAVDPASSRRGLGRALLEAAEHAVRMRGCHALRLEVRADNRSAIALYERQGYVRLDEVACYYEDGATALRFEKTF